jgi:hypothetical protein
MAGVGWLSVHLQSKHVAALTYHESLCSDLPLLPTRTGPVPNPFFENAENVLL